MLGLDLIRNTRVYQEAFTEGEQQGRLAGEQQGRLAAKLETVPSLIELGLSVEQIAQALAIRPLAKINLRINLNIDKVHSYK